MVARGFNVHQSFDHAPIVSGGAGIRGVFEQSLAERGCLFDANRKMDWLEAYVSEVLSQRVERLVANASAAVEQSRQDSTEVHGVVQDLVHVLHGAHDLANA